MKKLTLAIIFCCTIPAYGQVSSCTTYSQTNPPSTKKWYNLCMKKVIKPLQKNAEKNPYGCIGYEETIHTANGIIRNKVTLKYLSKSALPPQEPYLSMMVNDDTTYYFTSDSLYVFDRMGNLVCAKNFLKERWDFFANNPFLSFYAFYSFFAGGCTYEPFDFHKSGHTLIAEYTSPIFDDGGKKTLRDPYNPGRHHYELDMQNHALNQYVYEPCPSCHPNLGYTRKSYQLLYLTRSFPHMDYPDIIRQRNSGSSTTASHVSKKIPISYQFPEIDAGDTNAQRYVINLDEHPIYQYAVMADAFPEFFNQLKLDCGILNDNPCLLLCKDTLLYIDSTRFIDVATITAAANPDLYAQYATEQSAALNTFASKNQDEVYKWVHLEMEKGHLVSIIYDNPLKKKTLVTARSF